MSKSSWVIYNYHFVDTWGQQIDSDLQLKVLKDVAQKPTAYWAKNPEPDEYNTLLVGANAGLFDDEQCLVFNIGYEIGSRIAFRNDPANDAVILVSEPAKDFRYTRVILVPRLGIAAVRDGSGDKLDASSGAGRAEKVVSDHSREAQLEFQKSASDLDIENAIARLKLVEFTFEVRPFNPHPARRGEKFHEMLEKAQIGKVSGKATAKSGQSMTLEDNGLVSETMGMAEKGYGTYGAELETESGAEIEFPKMEFTGDKDADLKRQKAPRDLKIRVSTDNDFVSEELYVVRAILELRG